MDGQKDMYWSKRRRESNGLLLFNGSDCKVEVMLNFGAGLYVLVEIYPRVGCARNDKISAPATWQQTLLPTAQLS
jgi:hypothetical protein